MLESAHNASRCEQDCKEEEKCPLRNLYICTILCVCARVCACAGGGGRGGSGGCKESDKSIFFFLCAQHRPEMIKKVSFSSQKKKVLRV